MNNFLNLLGIGLLIFLSAAGLSLIIWSLPHSDFPAFSDDWMDEKTKKAKKKEK